MHNEEEPTDLDPIEHFVVQAGHKFCITCGPWLHSGALIFRLDWNEDYNIAERAENEESKCQAQLREIWEFLQAKFELQDLKQTWVAKAVCVFFLLSFMTILHPVTLYIYTVHKWH